MAQIVATARYQIVMRRQGVPLDSVASQRAPAAQGWSRGPADTLLRRRGPRLDYHDTLTIGHRRTG